MHTKQLFIEDMPPWDGRKILSSSKKTAEIVNCNYHVFPRKLYPTLKIFANFFFLEAILVGWTHLHSQKLTAKTTEKTMRKEGHEIPFPCGFAGENRRNPSSTGKPTSLQWTRSSFGEKISDKGFFGEVFSIFVSKFKNIVLLF